MPSVAEEVPTIPLCKKRRRDDDGENINSQSASSTTTQLALYPASFAKLNPTTNVTETIFSSFPLANNNNNHLLQQQQQNNHHHPLFSTDKQPFDHHAPSSLFHHHHHHHTTNQHPLVRKVIPLPSTKRARVDPNSAQRPGATTSIKIPTNRSSPSRTAASANLMSRCHICFRKPTKKSDLDSFADCQGCGERTCYVCIRECLGWRPPGGGGGSNHHQQRVTSSPGAGEDGDTSFTMLDADDASESDMGGGDSGKIPSHRTNNWGSGGHRQMVCSRCCVERGSDGDVVCLGCLPYVEG